MTSGLLIRGDEDDALRTLNDDERYRGRIKLAFVDPPFHTAPSREHDDHRAATDWRRKLERRLRQIRSLLAQDGSVWLYVDDERSAVGRALLEKTFGRSNFVTTVIHLQPAGKDASARLSVDHACTSSPPRTRRSGSRTRSPAPASPVPGTATSTTTPVAPGARTRCPPWPCAGLRGTR